MASHSALGSLQEEIGRHQGPKEAEEVNVAGVSPQPS